MFLDRKVRLSLSVFGIVFAFLVAFPPHAHTSTVAERCTPKLSHLTVPVQLLIGERFSRFDLTPLLDGSGFTLRLKKSSSATQGRTVEVPADPIDAAFLTKNVWRDIWELDGKKYEFVRVGFKSLEDYSNRVNEIVLNHLIYFPNEHLTVLYDPARTHIGQRLQIHRSATDNRVIEFYELNKAQLGAEVFSLLRNINGYSDNSDVQAILRYQEPPEDGHTVSFLETSAKDIQSRLLYTTQLTHFGDRDFFYPNLRQMVLSTGTPIIGEEKDLFPLLYRVPEGKERDAFREALYERFDPKATGEVMRDLLVDRKLPQSIKDKHISTLLKTGAANGLKYFIANVTDQKTADLFRIQYNFHVWRRLPVKDGVPEFVIYLEVDNPLYALTIDKLDRSARQVKTLWEPLP